MTLWFRYRHAGSGLVFGNHNYGYYRHGKTYNFTFTSMDNFTEE